MKRKVICYHLSSENNFLPTFRLNAIVIIRAKVKMCEHSHVPLRIHVIGGQRSVRITPCLLIIVVQKPETSSPPSQ